MAEGQVKAALEVSPIGAKPGQPATRYRFTLTINLAPGAWRLVEVDSTDVGNGGNPVGTIQSVRLSGGEVLFDDIEIRVP